MYKENSSPWKTKWVKKMKLLVWICRTGVHSRGNKKAIISFHRMLSLAEAISWWCLSLWTDHISIPGPVLFPVPPRKLVNSLPQNVGYPEGATPIPKLHKEATSHSHLDPKGVCCSPTRQQSGHSPALILPWGWLKWEKDTNLENKGDGGDWVIWGLLLLERWSKQICKKLCKFFKE